MDHPSHTAPALGINGANGVRAWWTNSCSVCQVTLGAGKPDAEFRCRGGVADLTHTSYRNSYCTDCGLHCMDPGTLVSCSRSLVNIVQGPNGTVFHDMDPAWNACSKCMTAMGSSQAIGECSGQISTSFYPVLPLYNTTLDIDLEQTPEIKRSKMTNCEYCGRERCEALDAYYGTDSLVLLCDTCRQHQKRTGRLP